MTTPRVLAWLIASIVLGAACTGADDGSGVPATGGSAASAAPAAGGSAGEGGIGGAAMTTGGMGGAAMTTGGSGGAAGSSGIGGMGGTGGSTDMASGGTGAIDGGTPIVDAGSAAHEAVPSAGCSLAAARPAGGLVSVADSHYVAFPESYEGSEPFPVLVGFHGCAEVNRGTSASDTEWMRLTEGTVFASEYVRVVPLSADSGGCWSYDADIARIEALYDELLESYCVDTRRVFATGHSSGAQMIVQILLQSHVSDAEHLSFAAVAPVAASDYGPIAGPIPVMYIQGMMDAERGNGDGHETVERFRAANGCGATSAAYARVEGCMSGSANVDPGCIAYEGCAAPTVWCSHNDPAYGGTMHGVPCFAVNAMHAFFESVREP